MFKYHKNRVAMRLVFVTINRQNLGYAYILYANATIMKGVVKLFATRRTRGLLDNRAMSRCDSGHHTISPLGFN